MQSAGDGSDEQTQGMFAGSYLAGNSGRIGRGGEMVAKAPIGSSPTEYATQTDISGGQNERKTLRHVSLDSTAFEGGDHEETKVTSSNNGNSNNIITERDQKYKLAMRYISQLA